MWTIIFFTSWQCSSFVMGNDDWLSHLSDEIQLKCEKSPLSHQKNEKLILYYVQLLMIGQVIQVTKVDWNAKKAPKSSKNEMLIFGLHSTSDDQPSDLCDEIRLKCEKSPLSHQTMKCSFLGYIQLLMIGQAIQVMKVDQNVKKWNVVSVRVFCCFSLGLLYTPLPRWKDRK